MANLSGARVNVSGMRIPYLIDQYPKISHAFVRREITAVEKEGVEVGRGGVRRPSEPAADAFDAAEAKNTHVLLDAGVAGSFRAFFRACGSCPLLFLRALVRAIQLGFASERGLLRHFVYLGATGAAAEPPAPASK